MPETSPPAFHLAERVAAAARELGIETAVIGALALAAHRYVRATQDVDLATSVDVYTTLRGLADKLAASGLSVALRAPDEDDPLGGVLQVWERVDDEGDPLEPVEVVNFRNPHHPRMTPAAQAIRSALPIDEASSLRCVRLPDLVALKLYAGAMRDLADIVELITRNPDADLQEIRVTCAAYDSRGKLEDLIAEAVAARRP